MNSKTQFCVGQKKIEQKKNRTEKHIEQNTKTEMQILQRAENQPGTGQSKKRVQTDKPRKSRRHSIFKFK